MTEYNDYDTCTVCGNNHGGALCPEIKCDCYPERNCEYCTALCKMCEERTLNELLTDGFCPKCITDSPFGKSNDCYQCMEAGNALFPCKGCTL